MIVRMRRREGRGEEGRHSCGSSGNDMIMITDVVGNSKSNSSSSSSSSLCEVVYIYY